MPSLVDFAYYAGLILASPVLTYKVARIRGRRHLAGLKERLGDCEQRPGRRPCIWIHGVSVGEIQAARTLVEAIERELPDYEIVLSTTTGTGQEVAKRTYPDKRVFYFPIDFTWSVARVFRAIRPSLVVLVELEIWPNFLHEAHRKRIPIALVNGRISAKSFRGYRFVQSLLFDPIGKIGLFFVQTDLYAERFLKLGIPARQIEVTGSVKYDQLAAPDLDPAEVRREIGVGPDDLVLMGGSTHPSEEASLLKAYLSLRDEFPRLRLVLVPRHTERTAGLLEELQRSASVTLRTQQLAARGSGSAPDAMAVGEVLLVDTVGELGRLYSVADLVFVGGSLIPHGGQNMLEPVMYGKPTLFGPHWVNFEEPVKRLLAAEGVREVQGAGELEAAFRALLKDPAGARAMGERGRQAMVAAQGATDATVRGLSRFLRRLSGRVAR
ncbi:MAG: 3-deoxy-D-manno-octulosonic acid transferase [Planctomycetes bacterium]|nr:3-deoxy-D-manno-octulosonic acid transferase [Planctomycetota bacterium]